MFKQFISFSLESLQIFIMVHNPLVDYFA